MTLRKILCRAFSPNPGLRPRLGYGRAVGAKRPSLKMTEIWAGDESAKSVEADYILKVEKV
jgi:hypothetical protein